MGEITPEHREKLRVAGKKGGLARAAKYSKEELGRQVHAHKMLPLLDLPKDLILPPVPPGVVLTEDEKLQRRRLQKRLWWMRSRGRLIKYPEAPPKEPRPKVDLSGLTEEEKKARRRQMKNDAQRLWRKKRSEQKTLETGLTPSQRQGGNGTGRTGLSRSTNIPAREDRIEVQFTGWGKPLQDQDFKSPTKRAQEETV